MTLQKEKAHEIVAEFRYALSLQNAPLGDNKDLVAKKCAIFHVEAIIKELSTEIAIEASSNRLDLYRQVKTEIENM